MKKYLFVFLIFAFGFSIGFSSVSIKLEGKVHSFNKDKIEISDETTIYSISKKFLSQDQIKSIESIDLGTKTNVFINFEAITEVRRIR